MSIGEEGVKQRNREARHRGSGEERSATVIIEASLTADDAAS